MADAFLEEGIYGLASSIRWCPRPSPNPRPTQCRHTKDHLDQALDAFEKWQVTRRRRRLLTCVSWSWARDYGTVSHAALQRVGLPCGRLRKAVRLFGCGRLFNPMSFRRIIEVWDAFEPTSMTTTYRAFEAELDETFLHFLPILKQIPNAEYARSGTARPWIAPIEPVRLMHA